MLQKHDLVLCQKNLIWSSKKLDLPQSNKSNANTCDIIINEIVQGTQERSTPVPQFTLSMKNTKSSIYAPVPQPGWR